MSRLKVVIIFSKVLHSYLDKPDLEKGNVKASSTISSFNTVTESIILLTGEEISEVQPSLHEERKNCCEKYCKGFLTFNYDLTTVEYKKFNAFKRECLIIYDQSNLEHEKLLKDFFENYVEIIKLDENPKDEVQSWKQMGFQVNFILFKE
jgi:hypothetical protein